MAPSTEYLFDADVLIDYVDADPSLIGLVSSDLAPSHVASIVRKQVGGLSKRQCRAQGLNIIEPSTQDLLEAANLGRLMSVHDAVCFVLARQRGFVCITNDKALRRCCADDRVRTRRGLRLIVDLVEGGFLTKRRARAVVESMACSNPGHIGPDLVSRIVRLIDGT